MTTTTRARTSTRLAFAAALAVVVVLIIDLIVVAPSQAAAHRARVKTAPASTGVVTASSRHAPPNDVKKIPKLTFLVTLAHNTGGYRTATAKHRSMKVHKKWYGRMSVLPVLAATADRLQVRLARRPNESTAWVNKTVVQWGITRSALLIDLSQRRLYVFERGHEKHSFPIGEGVKRTPTPTGTYFVAFHAPPNGPEYGSVMLETSAHSEVFKTFGGGNDAIIAIHGPINSDAAIGKNGARISNGCIRMHNHQLIKTAKVVDGTPLIITH
jgi:lipoprotein-anchoring transpeptidase ErfK/SrfK